MKSIQRNKLRLFAVMGIMTVMVLNAVSQEISKDELEKRAAYFFKTGRCEKALPDYQSLHNLYPKEDKYAYFLGRCYLQTYQNLDQAIELLKYVSTDNYKNDAYFYLGRAYHLTYRFDDATLAFTAFAKEATKRELKECNVDFWQTVNENAKKSTTVISQLNVNSVDTIPVTAPESAFAGKIPGKYVYVPDEFRSSVDKSMNYEGFMYLPKQLRVGEYLYFSSYSKNAKEGTDIFRVKQLASGNYSLPELLPSVINTQYDEAYPYFDSETGTLYFSSKGHNTSGGYDIFRSRFDSINNTWTTPEKLDFPINSTFDDFMYTTTSAGNDAVFLSNRDADPRFYSAYSLSGLKAVKYRTPANEQEVRLSASLEVTKQVNTSSLADAAGNEANNKARTPFIYSPPAPVTEYDKLVSEALELQARCDSVNWIIENLKDTRHTDKAGENGGQLEANINTLTAEAERLQKLSDERFAQAEKAKNIKIPDDTANITPAGVSEEQKNRAFVQNDKISQKVKPTGKQKADEAYNRGVIAARAANEHINSEFLILNDSPYSDSHPIPYTSLPPGLVYRIQLGSFSNRVAENTFKGLSPVNMEIVNDKGTTKYYVGYFSSLEDAREGLQQVKDYGFPDAFLVCYFDKEKISIEKAKEIEFAEK